MQTLVAYQSAVSTHDALMMAFVAGVAVVVLVSSFVGMVSELVSFWRNRKCLLS